jgi:hypothetical protein
VDREHRAGRLALAAADRTLRTAPVTHATSTLMFAEAGAAADAVTRGLGANAVAIERIAARLRRSPPASVTTCSARTGEQRQ